jgi:hypothetical protein
VVLNDEVLARCASKGVADALVSYGHASWADPGERVVALRHESLARMVYERRELWRAVMRLMHVPEVPEFLRDVARPRRRTSLRTSAPHVRRKLGRWNRGV